MKSVIRKMLHNIPSAYLKQELFKLIFKYRGHHVRELLLNEGDTAVIVGTPNQYRVHQFARLTGDSGQVVFIEPEPNNVKSLREAAREYSHVDIDTRGAWSTSGKQVLLLGSPSNPGDHKIAVDNIEHDNDYREENYTESVDIEVAPLDSILAEYEVEPDYIEIMVNGAELEVLKGATEVLTAGRPKLLMKGHQRNATTGEPMNRRLAEYVEQYGYQTVIGANQNETVGETTEWTKRAGDVYAWKDTVK